MCGEDGGGGADRGVNGIEGKREVPLALGDEVWGVTEPDLVRSDEEDSRGVS